MESFYDISGDIETESQRSSERNSVPASISYADIAAKLLNDKLLLTALELHSELLECGKEIPKLRDYFSNPGNFESPNRSDLSPCIPRSSSQATLDSLDLTRYSEDGERTMDDRVAVLEFELRKANEKIHALRANLTVATESETSNGGRACGSDASKSFLDDPIKPHEQRALNFLINEYLMLRGYKLTSITFADQNEDQDFEDWDDVGLNIPKPAGLLQLYRLGVRTVGSATSETATQTPNVPHDPDLVQRILEENDDLKEKLLISQKEKLELVIDCERVDGDGSEAVSTVDAWSQIDLTTSDRFCQTDEPQPSLQPAPLPPHVLQQIEEALTDLKHVKFNSAFEKEVWKEVEVTEDCTGLECISSENLLRILPRTIMSMIGTIQLTPEKLREMVCLLVHLILLNPEAPTRDELVQCLLNIKKRPQRDDRDIIISGLVRISRSSDCEDIIEGHLLPQCWELMNSKYSEKRLLVVEICSSIALYISSELRNSLLVSILQQMLLEDKDESVRVASVSSLALIVAFMEDHDKYQQMEELVCRVIEEGSAGVVEAGLQLLLPVVARWALVSERLKNSLLPRLTRLASTPRSAPVRALTATLPHAVVFLATSPHVLKSASSDLPLAQSRVGFGSVCRGLNNPLLLVQPSQGTASGVMSALDHCLRSDQTWPELDWLLSTMVPELLDLVERVDPSQEELLLCFVKLFKCFCAGFGFIISQKVNEIFMARLSKLESELMTVLKDFPPTSLISVFVLAMVVPLQVVDREESSELLERFVLSLSLSQAPTAALILALREASKTPDLVEPIMTAIWKGVVHAKSEVKRCAATLLSHVAPNLPEQVVAGRVMPALITLATDPDLSVRVSTLHCFAIIIESTKKREALDKIYLQIESVVADSALVESGEIVVAAVSALGRMAPNCDPAFREDVILGGLGRLVEGCSRLEKSESRARLAEALVDGYSNTIYCQISPQTMAITILPALRQLEEVCRDCLPTHSETVSHMTREVSSRTPLPPTQVPRSSSSVSLGLSQSNVDEMKQKVTKIFTSPIPKSTNLPIPNIFKKK